jgi:hypothetical protein
MAPTETPQAQNGLENAAAHAAEQANLSNEQDQTYDPLCCSTPGEGDTGSDKPTP